MTTQSEASPPLSVTETRTQTIWSVLIKFGGMFSAASAFALAMLSGVRLLEAEDGSEASPAGRSTDPACADVIAGRGAPAATGAARPL